MLLDQTKLIFGRNHDENQLLERLYDSEEDIIIYPKDIKGPTGIIRGQIDPDLYSVASKIMARKKNKKCLSPWLFAATSCTKQN